MPDLDPNDLEGFSAMLAEAAGSEPATAAEPEDPSYTPLDGEGATEPVEEEEPDDELEDDESDEPSEEEVDEAEDFVTQRFGGDVDKLAQSYQELERKLGEMGNELGGKRQLEREVDELRGHLQALMNRPEQTPAISDVDDWVDNALASDPRTHAIEVLQRGDTRAYKALMAAWLEDDVDAATDFKVDVALARQRAQVNEQINEVRQPVQQNGMQIAFAEAWTAVSAENPDLDDLQDDVLAEAKRQYEAGNETLFRDIYSGNATKAKGALDNLLLITRGRKAGGQTHPAVKQAAEAEATKQLARKAKARVAKSTGSAARGSKAAGEQLHERLVNLDGSNSIMAGLEIPGK